MVDSNLRSSRSHVAGTQNLSDAAWHLETFSSSPDETVVESGAGGVVPVRLDRPSVIRSPSVLPLEAAVSQPFPVPSTSPPGLSTPLQETAPDLSLCFAASALPSTDVSLPTPPIVKAGHDLRLPSFDLLGIAAPHPDRIALRSTGAFSPLGAGPLSKPEDPLHAQSPLLSRVHQLGGVGGSAVTSPEAARAQVEHLIPVVTPPNEPGTFNWGSLVKVQTAAGLGSPPSSDPGVSPSILTSPADASGPAPRTTIVVPLFPPSEPASAAEMEQWLEEVTKIIKLNLQPGDAVVKVLSHALPCPSTVGHKFPAVVAAIHSHTRLTTSWINVFHAVPGRFTLADLPKSPPSTPGPAVGGDEYFTSKVFDSAVEVADYEWNAKLMPPSPRPVVAPGSVDVSVLERYIPPTNAREFNEIFSMKGRSLLVDRLVELSSNNGTLLFIYPTRTGGRTFMNAYLEPILAPLLRSLAVVNDLSTDLGASIGQMASVNSLIEYEPLQATVERFCERLSDSMSPAHQKSNYTLVYSSKQEIKLERAVWASDWWVKQEKQRIRETVTKYFSKGKKQVSEEEVVVETMPSNYMHDIVNGVMNKEYPDGQEPSKGVEVGVFIIKKST